METLNMPSVRNKFYITFYTCKIRFINTMAIRFASFFGAGRFYGAIWESSRGVCIKGVYAVHYVPFKCALNSQVAHVGYKELKHNNSHSSNNLKLLLARLIRPHFPSTYMLLLCNVLSPLSD